ncbi:MarR family transcriptional regulator [Priestia megaterium]|uniref:MarR family winged helix-turn-helix transcriptional regulator n=1 Tax=Priestia megaterium TaxID=1404 RepID=UPI001C245C18|nr:MarR family transcriptional regulator [Priestia megaterium]MBU8588991.1 MarR family transcriptional regulator [Priestia megaterium]
MHLEDLTGYLIHRTDVKLTNYFMRQLKPYGITPEQWGIISILDSQKGTTQKELSQEIDKDHSTVVRMIHSMEKKGLVKKKFNERDKRSHYLFLTEKGEEIKNTILPVVKNAHDFVTSNLTFEEVEQLKILLNKIYDISY